MTRYKVAVIARALITPMNEFGRIDITNANLIDFEARNIEVDAESEEEAKDWVCKEVVANLYDERGGGPLWVPEIIAIMKRD
jgi:hypothetical protein